jgi:hypothetical protein
MIKEFIPYEEALALKELGLNNSCFGYYDKDGEFFYFETDDFNSFFSKNTIGELSTNRSSEDPYENFVCTAPTFSQAFRWFREKYNLVVIIQTMMKDSWLLTIESIDSTTANGVYNGKRWEMDNDENYVDPKSYEEAELLCLKKLIEIVKSKK